MSAPWVAAPRPVVEARISGTAFAVWLHTAKNRSHSTRADTTFPSRAYLMKSLGRADQDPRTITRATAELERAELLTRHWRRDGETTRRHYLLPGREEQKFVRVEHALLDWLARGVLTVDHLHAYTRWRLDARAGLTTQNSTADFARRYGMSEETVRRHPRHLQRLGLIRLDPRPGKASRLVVPEQDELDDILARTHPPRKWPTTPLESGRPLPSELADHPPQNWPTTPLESGRQNEPSFTEPSGGEPSFDRAALLAQVRASLPARAGN